ncbi:MAG TPA: alkaline phosphatase family protein [Polyangiaceae bacterium]|nr:alkaline phosphatase family protein [Polyangiaceae bacterium]
MSTSPVVVILVVGLTPSMLGPNTPHLTALAKDGFSAPLEPVLPAVTCSAQATLLTGELPRQHGIVANGWYFRELAEVLFWRQSNRLVTHEKVWEAARRARPGLTTAKLFWWYNMYSTAEFSITPRPIYPADGRKLPSVYSHPAELGQELQERLGTFPLFNFWGPNANLSSTEWIAKASLATFNEKRPDLTLIYLPHLDYCLQKYGPRDPRVQKEIHDVDRIAGELIEKTRARGAEVVVVSEYGIEQAEGAVRINQRLREAGLLAVQETLGWELLDAGASRAFAVADHQLAHVYVRAPEDLSRVRELLTKEPGIERVLDEQGKRELGLDHPRSGELVALAEPGYWFAYYYWLDDARAPDFARTVDIHRKPGYDPVELFLDPDSRLVKARIAWTLAKKMAGFRYLMDVIPLKPELVRGTHGRVTVGDAGPVILCSNKRGAKDRFHQREFKAFLLAQLGIRA